MEESLLLTEKDIPGRISSIVSIKGEILALGTEDGSLLLYTISRGADASGQIHESYTFERKKNLSAGSGKPVSQLLVVENTECLAVLAGEALSLYAIPSFETQPPVRECLSRVLCLAIDEGMDYRDTASHGSLKSKFGGISQPLLVGTSRHTILVLSLANGGSAYTISSEIQIAESPRFMKSSNLCILYATKTLYAIYDTRHGTALTVLEADNRKQSPAIEVFPERGIDYGIVKKDNIAKVISLNVDSGDVYHKFFITWAGSPVALIRMYPNLVSLQSDRIEIHNIIDPSNIVSSVPVSNAICASVDNNSIVVASAKSVHRLTPIPLDRQLDNLMQEGFIVEALDLLNRVSTGTAEFEVEQFRRWNAIAGMYRWIAFDFGLATRNFLESHMDPREILRLYPDICPLSLGMDSRVVEPFINRKFPSWHQDFCSPPSSLLPGLSPDISYSKVNGKQICMQSLVQHIFRKKDGKPPSIDAMEDLIQESYVHLHHYLNRYRRDVLKEESLSLSESSRDELQQAVDYSLLVLSVELGKKDFLHEFLRDRHMISLEHGEPFLRSRKLLHATALLFQSHGFLSDALCVWREIGLSSLRSSNEYSLARAYTGYALLQANSAELLWEHASWILQQDPHAGARIFIDHKLLGKVEHGLDYDSVLKYITVQSELALLDFLEYLVIEKRLQVPRYHTQLALRYVELIRFWRKMTRRQQSESSLEYYVLPGREAGELGKYRRRLIWILENSDLLNCDSVLSELEAENLFFEMLILLQKRGEHLKALVLMIFRMQDLCAAEWYCVSAGRRCPHRSFILTPILKPDSNESNRRRTLITQEDVEKDFISQNYNFVESDRWVPESARREKHYSNLSDDSTSSKESVKKKTGTDDSISSRKDGSGTDSTSITESFRSRFRRFPDPSDVFYFESAERNRHIEIFSSSSSFSAPYGDSSTSMSKDTKSLSGRSGGTSARFVSDSGLLSTETLRNLRSILFDYISILLHPHKYGLDLVDIQGNSDNAVHGEGLRETDGDEAVVLVTPNGPETSTHYAFEVMMRYAQYTDPVRIITILPEDASVIDVESYLAKTLQLSGHELRTMQVGAELSKIDHIKVQQELLGLRNTSVRIGSDRTCLVCKKRIGNAVFAVYPNGVVVHYLCMHKDSASICPMTGVDFSNAASCQLRGFEQWNTFQPR